MYFDIHTHKRQNSHDTNSIISRFPNDTSNSLNNTNYSIGIHPSFIQVERQELELETIKEYGKKSNIVAIGEIGLDKTSAIPFKLQLEVFIKQIKIAESFNKPIIIHCVKSFSVILKLKKSSTIPWIIHGFRGKSELASQLIKKGIYLSFGSAILNNSPTLHSTVLTIPLDKIFIETDNMEINIKELYKKIAEIKGISIESLVQAVNFNRQKVFNQ